MYPSGFEHGMNTWTAIQRASVQENLLDLSCKTGIFSAMLAGRTASPSIIATARDLKGVAEHADWVVLTLLRNEGKGQSWLREKIPSAFFKISRSCRSKSFSRFNWRIASSCGV